MSRNLHPKATGSAPPARPWFRQAPRLCYGFDGFETESIHSLSLSAASDCIFGCYIETIKWPKPYRMPALPSCFCPLWSVNAILIPFKSCSKLALGSLWVLLPSLIKGNSALTGISTAKPGPGERGLEAFLKAPSSVRVISPFGLACSLTCHSSDTDGEEGGSRWLLTIRLASSLQGNLKLSKCSFILDYPQPTQCLHAKVALLVVLHRITNKMQTGS